MITGFKTQLRGALTNAVSYFQDGGDPNAACVKAANEAGFNADQADRLVETFNTARVLCHYKATEDKTSSCSLADKGKVRAGLTPQEQKAASAESCADYDFYKQAEVDHVVPAVKEAAFELKEEPLSKEAQDLLRIREETTVRELLKEAEEEARAANSMADELAEKVAMAISRDVSLDHVHDRMARLVHAYALDERYAPGVEKVAAFLPVASDPEDISHLLKYARAHVVDTSDLSDVLPAIKEAADFAAEAAAFEAFAADLRKSAQAADPLPDDRDQLENLLLKERIRGERARNAAPAAGAKPAGGAKPSGGTGLASFLTYLTDTAKTYHDTGAAKRVEKATAGVDNLRRQLILQDLLTRDKVLSQEDPDTVASAFRSINQISPDSTLNKEMLRSMLRSAVQSVAISPYDAKTLVDVDKARRQAYAPKAQDNGGKDND